MEDKLTSLPQGWVPTTLEAIIDRLSNGITVRQNKENIGVPVTRIETISDGTINLNRVGYLKDLTPEIIEKYRLLPGDILFSHINSDLHLGKSALFNYENITVLHGMNLLLVRLFKTFLSPKWLNYLLNFYRLNGNFIAIAQHAVNQSSINQAKLKKIIISLPPLPEQRRIVAKSEELFTKLDAGVEALKKIIAQLKRYRQAVLKYAFEGKLTQEWREANKDKLEPASVLLERIKEERKKNAKGKFKEFSPVDTTDLPKLPKRWLWTRIGEISKRIQYGTSEKAGDDSRGIPVIRMGNIFEGKISFDNLKYFDKEWPQLNDFLLKDGDVLFNRTNSMELVGKTAVYKKSYPEAIFASYLIRVGVDKDSYNPDLLSFFINSFYGRKYISSVVSQQVGQANVNGTKLSFMPIPLPSFDEQKKIVEEIEVRLSMADYMKKTVEQTLKQSERLRQSILKNAFEGKLGPQEPTDEPAEKLLERIKAEKAKRESGTKGNWKKSKQMELI